MRNKKGGIELNTSAIIYFIIAALVLVVLILIFTGGMKDIISVLTIKIKNILGLWNSSQIKP